MASARLSNASLVALTAALTFFLEKMDQEKLILWTPFTTSHLEEVQ